MTDLTSIVEGLAKQALGGQAGQNNSGLGGMLGSVLGQLGSNQNNSSSGGLGGMLGGVLGSLTGGSNTGSEQNNSSGTQSLLVAVVPLILSWIQQQGGLQAALDKLRGSGLTSQVQNWVDPSTSEHSDVANDHVQNLFNDKEVEQVAEQTQTQKQDVYGAIGTVLPQIINALTPKGEQTNNQEANDDIQKVLGMVSGFLK
ncbi:hypothetical protein P256_00851 [Acinetobacter nectaris CIP 110549]|uniref:DUF937 domain-containing protein n=1 Tax=Acinetobacter nectaris CIP 110549 TaxID=1392540 RepID=V2UYM5_9GAMM|nr:YidB family protein [Acinetobacter nectaris]ESK40399.1 hypothetical protein P256_00851 [Acinetobacter nectaris CIP 110549]MCF9045827.1 DUF937 domain-containing protein [Acinetobacter nectaris]